MERTFTFPSEYLPTALAIVAKANKRAERLGCAPFAVAHTLRMAPRYTEADRARLQALGTDLPDAPIVARMVEVADLVVSGAAPVVAGGWTFGAAVEVLDHDDAGRPLCVVYGPRSADCADLREAAPACEHCRTVRRRLQTYALFAADGRRVVVGSSCLADFLGGADPVAAVGILGVWRDLVGGLEDEEGRGCGRGTDAWNLSAVAEVAAAWIAQRGYVSRAMARDNPGAGQTTASCVALWMVSDKFRKESELEVREGDKAAAVAVLADWSAVAERVEAARASGAEVSDWDWKLYVMHRAGYVSERLLGVAVGAVKGTMGAMARKAADTMGPGGFLGQPGERTAFRLVVDSVKAFDSDYGTRLLVLGHVDGTPDRVTYWTAAGGKVEYTQGAVLDVKGTIKAHEDHHKYGKRTVVQRLSLAKAAKAKAAKAKAEAAP